MFRTNQETAYVYVSYHEVYTAVGVGEKPRVFLYELIQKHHVTK